jgi:hypothetical protein
MKWERNTKRASTKPKVVSEDIQIKYLGLEVWLKHKSLNSNPNTPKEIHTQITGNSIKGKKRRIKYTVEMRRI